MTESEWLAATKPRPMLDFLAGKVSDRKLRLLVCADCRRIWQLLSDSRSRDAVFLAEQLADGEVTFAECVQATDAAHAASHAGWDDDYEQHDPAATVARYSLSNEIPIGFVLSLAAVAGHRSGATDEALAAQVVLVRDIFGNPFRPVTVSPDWLTSTVIALVRQMYESRDFSPMPILADALQDAGCDSEDILGHCRGPGPHVRGCWVIDLLLGKK